MSDVHASKTLSLWGSEIKHMSDINPGQRVQIQKDSPALLLLLWLQAKESFLKDKLILLWRNISNLTLQAQGVSKAKLLKYLICHFSKMSFLVRFQLLWSQVV